MGCFWAVLCDITGPGYNTLDHISDIEFVCVCVFVFMGLIVVVYVCVFMILYDFYLDVCSYLNDFYKKVNF